MKRSRTQERLPGAGASLLTAGTEETDDHDALQLFPFELDQEQLPEDVDFVRIFTSPTQFTYQLDDAGKRQRVVLSAEQKELLVELDSLMQQKDWHPCAIPMKHKAVLMTNNCQLVRQKRRKFYHRLSEKCNMHDRHSGFGFEVPPVYAELPHAENQDLEAESVAMKAEAATVSVATLNLNQQPLKEDLKI